MRFLSVGLVRVLSAGLLLGGLPASAFKVYVFVDMEGISGITDSGQTLSAGARYDEGRRLMAGDMNACVAGCFAAGATEVVVRDGHSSGTNVDPSAVDPRAKLIQGPTPGVRFKGLEGSEAVILLGYHAKARTDGALLAHSYSSSSIQGLWLNGREVGEIGLDAAIAAEHNIPVVLVSGDDKAVAEAREWIPGVFTCATKKGTGPQSAQLVPLEEARRLIRERTAAALHSRKELRPIKVTYPATLRWEYLPKGSLRTYDPAFEPVAHPRTVEKTGDSVENLFLQK